MIGGQLRRRYSGAFVMFSPDDVHNAYLHNEYEGLCVSSDEWKTLAYCAEQVAVA
jgi:hypothetical protein